jgi:hypothetical protein
MDRHLQVPLLSQTYIVRFKAHVRFAYLAMNMLLTQRRSGIRPLFLMLHSGSGSAPGSYPHTIEGEKLGIAAPLVAQVIEGLN